MSRLFREHKLFKSVDGDVRVYTCLEVLGEGKFAVQLMSFCPAGDMQAGLKQHDHYQADTLEGFLENPDIAWRNSLEEAIDDHDAAFENE